MKKTSLFLLYLILLSSVVLGIFGVILKYEVLPELGIRRDEHPIALPFVLLADETLKFQVQRSYDLMMNPPTEPSETVISTTVPPTIEPETAPPTEAPTDALTEPPVTEPPYIQVDESWFDDVLFIGDSRSVGLKQVARLGKAHYFCVGSMSVFTVQKWECYDEGFGNHTLNYVLKNNTYGKVYIHLGLNEIGNDVDLIMEQYMSLIDLVRQTQPDAYIIIQSVMSITRGKASNPKFPIEHLLDMNQRLKELAESDPEVYRFCDVNSWIADEEGYMLEEMTHDGCHLLGTGYMQWSQWILEDAGWYGIP